MKGKISEIFDSVQGEGLYLGEKQLFVRFFGCNLNCKFCDTKLHHFTEYEPQELLDELNLYHDDYHSVSFTGGEPLIQKDFLKEALALTLEKGYTNYLETNGTLPEALEEVIDFVHIVAMDLKLSSSTGLDNFWQEHRRSLEIAAQKGTFLKTVICQSTREEDLRQGLNLLKETNRFAILVLQPNSYERNSLLQEKLVNFKEICLNEGINACVIPQMHKIIGIK